MLKLMLIALFSILFYHHAQASDGGAGIDDGDEFEVARTLTSSTQQK